MIQKSYSESEYGKLYLIPTPIGNLDDITYRAINTLRDVDMVFAEDTRVTINLLKHFDISKKVESCHKYTEMKNKDKIINILKSGKNIGYVTDRGTPLISAQTPSRLPPQRIISTASRQLVMPPAAIMGASMPQTLRIS